MLVLHVCINLILNFIVCRGCVQQRPPGSQAGHKKRANSARVGPPAAASVHSNIRYIVCTKLFLCLLQLDVTA